MPLEADIAEWDRKSKVAISRIYGRYTKSTGFLEQVIGAFGDADLQSGATWLLKHHFDEGGGALESKLVKKIYGSTPNLIHWDAKLHVLQCMERLPIPKSELRRVEAFLRHCMKDDAKFVRAWAYSGFHELAVQYPAFRPEAAQILENALTSETAGSVRSRVKRKIKQGF